MVILECMACGTPAMATNVGGIKELIADNVMCFVDDGRDPVRFAELALTALAGRKDDTPDKRFSSATASELINNILSGLEI
jgi:glycosyltransferase involved in cell wall biosynthesis